MADIHEIIRTADQLFAEYKFEEVCCLLRQHVQSVEYEILWRLARSLYSLYKEKKSAHALILEGFQTASKLLDIAPNASASHKYYAVFLGEKAGIDGTKQQILSLTKVLAHIKISRDENELDPFVWHLEGVFYEKLASLQWYEKLFVYALNKDLVQPSYDDALRCLLRAEQIEPHFFALNEFLIGKVYFQQKNFKNARPYLTRIANLEVVRTADDKFSKEAAAQLLGKM
ncbi:regulator of microtubule dynamics protein 1-like [Topomyia yanbarensis]|uniref:regulator of microtubule dynamics protein 1-like n=1 Tax=Topomyia yanbarensis TaxID=2498891 RepID=UPI00273CA756|nr:regulator of microtubule dynamics protein 1-like [Topomyia yanbarensis]